LTLAGQKVEVDRFGFLIRSTDWSFAIAEALAVLEAIELEHAHWRLIRLVRKFHRERHRVPSVREICDAGDVTLRQLYDLFPPTVLKLFRVSGMSKPGCGGY